MTGIILCWLFLVLYCNCNSDTILRRTRTTLRITTPSIKCMPIFMLKIADNLPEAAFINGNSAQQNRQQTAIIKCVNSPIILVSERLPIIRIFPLFTMSKTINSLCFCSSIIISVTDFNDCCSCFAQLIISY